MQQNAPLDDQDAFIRIGGPISQLKQLRIGPKHSAGCWGGLLSNLPTKGEAGRMVFGFGQTGGSAEPFLMPPAIWFHVDGSDFSPMTVGGCFGHFPWP
jgi:hypothetical protein